jgi:hypothetical protein
MSRLRKAAFAAALIVALAAAAIGLLTWQAGAAADAYPKDLRSNIARYEKVYTDDPTLTPLFKQIREITAALPKQPISGASAKSRPAFEVAAKIGAPLGELYRASTPILRREIADTPHVRSVPLGRVLSKRYREAQAQEERVDALYAKGLAISVDAAEFYPGLESAYRRAISVLVSAPLEALANKAQSELRELNTMAEGGNPAKDALAGVRDRITTDAKYRKIIAETALPPSFQARKEAILKLIDDRASAAKIVEEATFARDLKAYRPAAKTYNANNEAKYVGDYLRLYSKAINLHDDYNEVAKEINAVSGRDA